MNRILVPFLLVAVSGAIAALMYFNKPAPQVRSPEERVTQVQIVSVQTQEMVMRVASQGTVEPRTQTTLVAEVSGRVLAVADNYVTGGFFRAGDILVTLDSADYEVSLQQARANLLTAQSQLTLESAQAEQAARQWDSSGRARADAPPLALRIPYLEEARARVLFAEADLARAERQLERTRIRAPYDGLVREKMVDIGQYVGTGSQIAQTFAVDYAEIRLPLTDRDIAFLALPRPGVSAWGVADSAIPVVLRSTVGGRDFHWQGRIVRTDGVVDSNTRVYHAVAQVEDPYGLRQSSNLPPLSIGSFVNATLEGIAVANVVTLPHSAVRNGNQVMIMDSEQRLRVRVVNVLRSDAERVYIDSGLVDGEQVIVSPVPVPIEGMRVVPGEVMPGDVAPGDAA